MTASLPTITVIDINTQIIAEISCQLRARLCKAKGLVGVAGPGIGYGPPALSKQLGSTITLVEAVEIKIGHRFGTFL
jgi:hypothetical protein